jgi:polysaccharide export outer membrane protein
MRFIGMRIFALLGLLAFMCVGAPAAFAQPSETPAVAAARSAAPSVNPEYRVGPGDRLRIIVFGQTDLGGDYQLDGSGVISLPLIGQLQVRDKTVRELEAAIADKLRDGYLSDPRVSAEVLNFRPFCILGEVNRPGEYPFTDGLTVMKAVATAQGYTYRANQKRVFIKRANDTDEKANPLTGATAVGPGDTIRIPERFF